MQPRDSRSAKLLLRFAIRRTHALFPAPPPQFIAHLSSATVAHPRLPTPGSRECGTRNFNFTANPKTNQLLSQLPQWYHPPSPCVNRNRTNYRVRRPAIGWATRHHQDSLTKRGGYRVSTKKSEQAIDHEHKQIRTSQDAKDEK